jgi:indole-3-glycerol phosphate synthase/phosphoribosylanthranilate isomerase
MQTVLAKIVADKAIWVAARKSSSRWPVFRMTWCRAPSLLRRPAGYAHRVYPGMQKASPSKGVIRDDFDPARIAGVYKHHASAISVLTDEKYFQGSFDFLPVVSQIAHQPIPV